jgi:NDP-sugar pyrophosphorylase family protein
MSYRLTEAERKHIATIEDSKIWISGNYENNIPVYDIYVSDNDQMNGLTDNNFHIRLPKYIFKWDDSIAKLHLIDVSTPFELEIVTDGSNNKGIGWRYTLSTEKIDGTEYVTALTFTRDNDVSSYTLDMTKLGDMTLKSLVVDETTRLSGELKVNSPSTFDSTVTISGITTLQDDLQAENADFNQDVKIDGKLDVYNKASFYSGVLIEKGLTSYGTTYLHGNTYVTSDGNLTVAGDITGKKNGSFKENLSAKEINASSGITAGGDITSKKNLIVHEDIYASGNLYISGNQEISGSLEVKESITSPSGIINVISGEEIEVENIYVTDNTTTGRLTVDSTATIGDSLDAGSITTPVADIGSLNISEVYGIGSNPIQINSETQFNNDVLISGRTWQEEDGVDANGDPKYKNVSSSGNLIVAGYEENGQLQGGNLTVYGFIDGDKITANDLDVANQISGNTVIVQDITSAGINSAALLVTNDTTLNGQINISGDTVIKGTTLIEGENTLYVNTDSYFNKDAQFFENILVDKNTNISGTLEVKDVTTLKDHTYIGASGIMGGTPITFVSHTETLNLNDPRLLLYAIITGSPLTNFKVDTQRAIDVTTGTEYIDDPSWPVIQITSNGSIFTGETKNPGLAVIHGIRKDGQLGQVLVQVTEDGSWLYDGGSDFTKGHYLSTDLGTLSLTDPLEDPNNNPLVFGMPTITGGTVSNIGSKNLYVHGDIYAEQKVDTFQINDDGTENQLVIYSSGLTPTDLDHDNMYDYTDPDRIKAIINGEVQFLATLEDIHGVSLSGSVTLNTNQTITGTKYFTSVLYSDSLYTYTPDGPGAGDEQRLIARELNISSQPNILVGNYKEPLIIHSAMDEHYGIIDAHIKVLFDHTLSPETLKFLANTDDIVIPEFSDPTNGQVLGDASLSVKDGSGIFNFVTLDSQITYEDTIYNGTPVGSGIFELAIQTDEYLSITSAGTNAIKISNTHIENITGRLDELEEDTEDIYDTVFEGSSGIIVKGDISSQKVEIGINHIDFELPNNALKQEERFPTTYAVMSGLAEETQRATIEENKLKQRLPEAPDVPGYYAMTAQTIDPDTTLYAWRASQLPPTPIESDSEHWNAGDEFGLKFILNDPVTGEGVLVWEKIN